MTQIPSHPKGTSKYSEGDSQTNDSNHAQHTEELHIWYSNAEARELKLQESRNTRKHKGGKYERKNRHRMEARRKTGLSREEYEAVSSLKAQKAMALRENGLTWKQVAQEIGAVSVDAAQSLVKRFKDKHNPTV